MKGLIILFLSTFFLPGQSIAQLNIQASRALLHRIVPEHEEQFVIQSLPGAHNNDVFEIESKNQKVVLRGTTGVAIASALYYYLNTFCHCQVTWNGTNMKLPHKLPGVTNKIHKTTSYEYRYYLNYCTFNYSISWWDWPRWEKEIDWMALHGINMPLAITGEEYTWHSLYKEMGFSDVDLSTFFSGPSYFAWFWMGNLDGWGGPLPLNWMKSHKLLQQKILQRERQLGMKPVMPAFTGHVPAAFKKRFPSAKLKATNWHNGFSDTYILDAKDSLFKVIAKRFLKRQSELYGTDHLYSADTFNENEPPSDDPSYLSDLSATIYQGMRAADSKSTWVMQGWLFYSDRKFWKAPQIKALLDAVPDSAMILLDLAAEIEPVWKRTEAFYGKPWIWNMLHNFGGNISLFGRMDLVASAPAEALNNAHAGQLKGIGLTMEGIEQNPVLYELMTAHTWNDSIIDLNKWIPQYILNRYGGVNDTLISAWQNLRTTVYNGKRIRDGAESIITGRPTFDSATTWTRTALNYDPLELLPSWDALVYSSGLYKKSDGFQYDLVDLTRQVLANYAMRIHQETAAAYYSNNLDSFIRSSARFLELIGDMDTLLATRKDFLLGPWLEAAKRWGSSPPEKNIYERNARDLITLWGDSNSPLHEYSCRQWSGLLTGFYKYRWQRFFSMVGERMRKGQKPDLQAFQKEISGWEWKWVNAHTTFPLKPTGDPILISRRLYKKYRKEMY